MDIDLKAPNYGENDHYGRNFEATDVLRLLKGRIALGTSTKEPSVSVVATTHTQSGPYVQHRTEVAQISAADAIESVSKDNVAKDIIERVFA